MITLLGVGAAFTTPEYWNTNFLITSKNDKHLLIDCGSDIRHSMAESDFSANDVDAVYISHNHADHSGGLEWLGFSNFRKKSLNLYCHPEYEQPLKQQIDLSLTVSVDKAKASTFFEIKPVDEFIWEEYQFKLVKNTHIACKKNYNSYGLFVTSESTKCYISTDTIGIRQSYIKDCDICFHDCETGDFVSDCHTRYDELKKIDKKLKAKIVLVHYNPSPSQDAKSDGFMKFGSKGENFTI